MRGEEEKEVCNAAMLQSQQVWVDGVNLVFMVKMHQCASVFMCVQKQNSRSHSVRETINLPFVFENLIIPCNSYEVTCVSFFRFIHFSCLWQNFRSTVAVARPCMNEIN